MKTVYTLNEAMQFFLSNSSGQVDCIDGMDKKTVNSYPEAVKFYRHPEQ